MDMDVLFRPHFQGSSIFLPFKVDMAGQTATPPESTQVLEIQMLSSCLMVNLDNHWKIPQPHFSHFLKHSYFWSLRGFVSVWKTDAEEQHSEGSDLDGGIIF